MLVSFLYLSWRRGTWGWEVAQETLGGSTRDGGGNINAGITGKRLDVAAALDIQGLVLRLVQEELGAGMESCRPHRAIAINLRWH